MPQEQNQTSLLHMDPISTAASHFPASGRTRDVPIERRTREQGGTLERSPTTSERGRGRGSDTRPVTQHTRAPFSGLHLTKAAHGPVRKRFLIPFCRRGNRASGKSPTHNRLPKHSPNPVSLLKAGALCWRDAESQRPSPWEGGAPSFVPPSLCPSYMAPSRDG